MFSGWGQENVFWKVLLLRGSTDILCARLAVSQKLSNGGGSLFPSMKPRQFTSVRRMVSLRHRFLQERPLSPEHPLSQQRSLSRQRAASHS